MTARQPTLHWTAQCDQTVKLRVPSPFGGVAEVTAEMLPGILRSTFTLRLGTPRPLNAEWWPVSDAVLRAITRGRLLYTPFEQARAREAGVTLPRTAEPFETLPDPGDVTQLHYTLDVQANLLPRVRRQLAQLGLLCPGPTPYTTRLFAPEPWWVDSSSFWTPQIIRNSTHRHLTLQALLRAAQASRAAERRIRNGTPLTAPQYRHLLLTAAVDHTGEHCPQRAAL